LIYPNPVEDRLNIDLKETPSAPVSLKVLSPQGQVLMQQLLSGTRNQVDLSGLVAGMYYIQLDAAGWHFARKIVKR